MLIRGLVIPPFLTEAKSRGQCAICAIRCDNGPEYISQQLTDWANKRRITLLYIQPGKPTQNAYIERFNRTARHEWLDLHLFASVEQAQLLATEWLWTYNNQRPHSAIGGLNNDALRI